MRRKHKEACFCRDESWPKTEPRPVSWNCSAESRKDHHGARRKRNNCPSFSMVYTGSRFLINPLPRQARDKHHPVRINRITINGMMINRIMINGRKLKRPNNKRPFISEGNIATEDLMTSQVRKRRTFLRCHLMLKIPSFTKTGSGQT